MAFEETAGLTKGEKKVYLALAGQGPCTATPIVRATGLQKSAVYFCLDRLIGKGLVSYATRNNRKVFEAAPTEKLGEFIDARKNDLEVQKKELEQAVESLLASKPKSKSGAKVFEGWNGLETALEDILNMCKKGEEYHVFSVSVHPKILDRYRRLFGRFHARRAEKGIRIKMLIDEKLKQTLGSDREATPLTKVKYMPSSIFTPAALAIYHDKVLISIAGENPSAMIIQNKEVADSFRAYFDLVWGEEAKTYYGLDGMRAVLEDVLKSPEMLVIGGRGQVGVKLKDYMLKEFTPKAVAKCHKWRILGRQVMKGGVIAGLPFVQMKYMPERNFGPNVIWVWGDKVANTLLDEKPVIFVLENKQVAKSYREYFELLWNQEARTYHGLEGIKEILEDTLNYPEVLFIGGSGAVGERMREYFVKEYTPRAIEKKHVWKNLARPIVKKRLVGRTPFVENRYLPELRLGPNVIWIYGNKTANVVWAEKPVAFVLENKTVTKSYREYFDWLWKQAKK